MKNKVNLVDIYSMLVMMVNNVFNKVNVCTPVCNVDHKVNFVDIYPMWVMIINNAIMWNKASVATHLYNVSHGDKNEVQSNKR